MTEQEIEKIQADYADAQNELSAVYKVNEVLQEEVARLMKAAPVVNHQSSLTGFQSAGFELDGEKYGFNFPQIKFKGQLLTHMEIAADETLQRELLKIGAGIIKKIK